MIRLIAAIDDKRGIAKNGAIPWDIPEDRKFFREHTSQKGAVILMGRKTYETIGHPLPNRRNIVLSNNTHVAPGVENISDLSILNMLSDVWIIGGEAIYQQTIASADELYLTHVETDFKCDQFFPDYSELFVQAWRSEPKEQNGLKFWYEILTRHPR